MTSTEAAEILKVSPRRVTQLAAAGQLPGVKEGRDWHFERADVEAFALIQRPAGYPKGKPRFVEEPDEIISELWREYAAAITDKPLSDEQKRQAILTVAASRPAPEHPE